MPNNEDDDSVVAVNKYVGPDKQDKEKKETKQESSDRAPFDLEDAGAGDASAPKTQPVHPPSFFTDHRGNLKAVNLVVRKPCLIFSLLIAICLLLTFLLNVLVFRTAEGSPFTIGENEFDLADERSVQLDSYRLARDQVQAQKARRVDAGKAIEQQSELAAVQYWVFEADREQTDKGVFGSVAAIEGMKDAYDIFTDDPAYQDYCLRDFSPGTVVGANETRPCRAPLSPLGMYYASEWDEAAVGEVIDELTVPGNVERFNSLALCVIQQMYCDISAPASDEDRLWTINMGAKIAKITSTWDQQGELVPNYEQVTQLALYLMQLDIFRGLVDFGYDKGFSLANPVSHFSRGILFWGGPLEARTQSASEEDEEETEDAEGKQRKEFIKDEYLDKMNEQSEKDTHAEINSYYFMTSLIGDVILSIVVQDALLAIFSFVFVFLWLRVNTNSWFLAFVGFFEILFSIPIAWFIFTVIFRIKYFATLNSLAVFVVAAIGADDIFIFMDAYKQSQYIPELLCDLETRMSWVYRRTGTAMAITSATTCCAFLANLITPLAGIQSFGIFAAVVILIDYVLVMTLFCTSVVIYHNRFENQAKFGCCCPCGLVTPSNTEQARLSLEEHGEDIKQDRVSEFFKTRVAGFIKVPLHRLVLFVVFMVWLGVALWQATLIEATKENEQFLNEENPLQKSITILNKEFPTAQNDLGLKVYFAWGLDEVDRTGVNLLLDPENFGAPTFVPEFDFNQQCQTDLLAFCDKLKTDAGYTNLIKRKDGVGSVFCFIEELAAYNVNGNLEDCDSVKKGEWRNKEWQVDPNDLAEIMPGFLQEKTCFDDGGETVSGTYQNEIGWNGAELVFAAVSAESNVLDPFGLDAESATRREYDQFVAIAKEQNAIISQSCSGAVIMTDLDNKFVFMNNQVLYVQSAIQNSVLGVAIAFVILLISTRVLHIAFFASLSITAVLISVVGTMVMSGWYLGSIESTLIGIIAGFSVDYVVHLAHAYEIAEGDTYSRVTEAFGDLGVSVFNGMITSVVASLPLFFCQLQFFAKFGTFLCLTIVYSWIFANFGFMSLLAQLKIPLKESKGCRL